MEEQRRGKKRKEEGEGRKIGDKNTENRGEG